MARVNPRNNATMQRVQAPAPVIVKTPPPKKTTPPPKFTRKKITQPSSQAHIFIPQSARPDQNRNVTQPVKQKTDWCNCEFWDLPCKAGCLAQEQIVDPVVSGANWIGKGFEEQVTEPLVSGAEWWTQGATDAVASTQEAIDVFGQNTQDAYNETLKFFGDATASTFEAVDVFGQNTQDAINSTVDAVTDSVKFIQESVGGTADWAGQQLEGVSNLTGGLGSMMGNMMRGMGNLANVGSSSMGWIKWVLIAIGALIAGFIAWRVLK